MPATTAPRRNWAGNVRYRATGRLEPTSLDELRAVVRDHEHVKAVGTGHSFNRAADSDGAQVSLARMPDDLALDDATGVLSAPGGATYARVSRFLHERGRALSIADVRQRLDAATVPSDEAGPAGPSTELV